MVVAEVAAVGKLLDLSIAGMIPTLLTGPTGREWVSYST